MAPQDWCLKVPKQTKKVISNYFPTNIWETHWIWFPSETSNLKRTQTAWPVHLTQHRHVRSNLTAAQAGPPEAVADKDKGAHWGTREEQGASEVGWCCQAAE